MTHKYTLNECIQIVNCCYFVGSCHSCPAHKHTGYANIVRCVGAKEVGEALLGILEPLSELERAKNPTLFDAAEDAAEDTTGDPAEDYLSPEETPEESAEEAEYPVEEPIEEAAGTTEDTLSTAPAEEEEY